MSQPFQPIDPEEALSPIFRELGKAIYIGQQFETCLLYLLALLNHRDGKVDEATFADGFASYEPKTLGQLAKLFRERLDLPEGFPEFMREGVELRNSLAHGFVMRNTIEFRTAEGREKLINQLKDAQYVLEQRRRFAEDALSKCVRTLKCDFESLRHEAEKTFYVHQLASIVRH